MIFAIAGRPGLRFPVKRRELPAGPVTQGAVYGRQKNIPLGGFRIRSLSGILGADQMLERLPAFSQAMCFFPSLRHEGSQRSLLPRPSVPVTRRVKCCGKAFRRLRHIRRSLQKSMIIPPGLRRASGGISDLRHASACRSVEKRKTQHGGDRFAGVVPAGPARGRTRGTAAPRKRFRRPPPLSRPARTGASARGIRIPGRSARSRAGAPAARDAPDSAAHPRRSARNAPPSRHARRR